MGISLACFLLPEALPDAQAGQGTALGWALLCTPLSVCLCPPVPIPYQNNLGWVRLLWVSKGPG